MICDGKTVAEIAAAVGDWPGRIRYMNPRNVVELGTGQGASGAQIMSALAPDAMFTTINYADGHKFGEQLRDWYFDQRLRRLDLDTTDPATLEHVPAWIDLLFIDTTHEAWHAATELRLWQDKLQDGAIVIVDDLNQHDMANFWDSIPYEKVPTNSNWIFADRYQGVFRYDASKRYEGKFPRPEKTDYVGDRIRRK